MADVPVIRSDPGMERGATVSGANERGLAQTTPVQSLAGVLEEELSILLHVKEIAQKQKSILSGGRPDDVWENLADLEICWQELHRAEDRRQPVARRVSEMLGMGGRDLALREVVAALPVEAGTPLRQLQAALTAATKEVTELNAHNATLIQGLLRLMGQRLQFYTSLQEGYQPYDALGRRAGGISAAPNGGRLA
ncbi:MAG: flagellar protein FlgN [Chloroflexota bacterium]|nr:MAG: flagellar protein FlgN [Chloroflexota bacterium]